MERISEVIERAIKAISEQGYGVSTQRNRRYSFLRILRAHEQHGAEEYDELIIAGYVNECIERHKRGEIVWARCRELTKAAEQLAQIRSSGLINSSKRSFAPTIPDYYEGLQKLLAEQSECSENDRRNQRYTAGKFFKWLINRGHDDLSALDEKLLRQYLIHCAGYLTGQSLDTIRRSLRKAFRCFASVGVISDPYERIFTFTIPMEKKIILGIPHSEIAATLKMIDRGTVMGKRDYAMIMIAVMTGLRAVDIAGLEIGSIDWKSGEIRLIQSKTKKSLALPLTTDVGKAVRDYIANARPTHGMKSVFLSSRAPYRAICGSGVSNIHNRYRQKAGLPKSGVHGLRRALGSAMVSAYVPLTTAMQVLGQTELDSTKSYMPLNSKQLKECALSFAGIEVNRIERKRGGAR